MNRIEPSRVLLPNKNLPIHQFRQNRTLLRLFIMGVVLLFLPIAQVHAEISLPPIVSLLLSHGRVPAQALSVGANHNCVLLENGKIACWGNNLWGQLGNGSSTSTCYPTDVRGVNSSVGVAAGVRHSCAVLENGTAQCWGDNSYGELGNNIHGTGRKSLAPVPVNGISSGGSIAVGDNLSCIVLTGGNVLCWGHGSDGQLGNNATGAVADRDVPEAVYLTGYTGKAVSIGGFHACMVDNDPLLLSPVGRCWGRNTSGQLGIGTYVSASTPRIVKRSAVATLFGVDTISAGENHTCATLSTGRVYCWGWNGSGQIGLPANSPTSSNLPAAVASFGLTGFPVAVAVSAGGNHSCVLTDDGQVWCWGKNDYGQLGRGTSTVLEHIPVVVTGIHTAIAIGTGDFHSCALLSNRSVWCWGRNNHGQLGVTAPAMSDIPVRVIGLPEQL